MNKAVGQDCILRAGFQPALPPRASAFPRYAALAALLLAPRLPAQDARQIVEEPETPRAIRPGETVRSSLVEALEYE